MPRLVALLAVAVLVLVSAFRFASRSGEPVLPDVPYNYAAIALPDHLTAPPVQAADNTPASNPITDAGATLGRVLFYDTRLSLNESISCSSCHLQEHGFSDPEPFSVGFEGGRTARNSMGLAFSRYYENGHFFWDERAGTLEAQTLMPIQDAVEMGMTLDAVITRLEATGFYGNLFADAFGTPEVTSDRMALALSQFVRSMVAPGSRYDQGRALQPPGPPGNNLPNFTAEENQGLRLFFGQALCGRCHEGDLMVNDRPRNNGLDATTTDAGVGGVTGRPQDMGLFKSGSLRNIGRTAPYMHDGRFETLEEVVDFYNTGIQPHPNLDPILRRPGGQPVRLNLNPGERAALVAFLETLTDEAFIADVRWSDPFLDTTEGGPSEAPSGIVLEPAYPNPFNPSTTLRFNLVESTHVDLSVFDQQGRRVALLEQGIRTAGTHTVRWDAQGVPSGRYLVRMVAGGVVQSQAVTLVK